MCERHLKLQTIKSTYTWKCIDTGYVKPNWGILAFNAYGPGSYWLG